MSDEREDIVFETELESVDPTKSLGFDLPLARFQMARWVLICLFGLICFLIIYRIAPDGNASEDVKSVFDKVFDSVVPIASLILGYYFGSSNKSND